MATSKKFSELPAASSVGNGDLFAIAHEDALAETGYVSQKLTAAQAGQKVNGDTEYPSGLPSFPTGSQNPFDALEKLNADIEALYPVNQASGSIANFSTSLALPLVACKAQIVAQQAGTGTPSPSNPMAISGFSSVKFGQTGKNLFDKATVINNAYVSGSTGEETPTNGFWCSDFIKVNANTNYITNTIATGARVYVFYDNNKNYVGTSSNQNITTPNNTTYIRINGKTSDITPDDVQLELGSTATSYEAYTGNTFTVALGDTYYGGVLDCKNGTATITHACVNLSNYVNSFTRNNNQNNPNGTIYQLEQEVIFKGWTLGGSDDAICSHLQKSSTASVATADANSFYWTTARTGYRIIYGLASGGSTLEDLQTFLTNNTVVVCGELETPVEITGLTTGNFTTFAGEQNIYADSGDVEVSFKQGIQEYIDAKIAETQALIL